MRTLSVVFDYGSVLAWPPSSDSCERVAATAGIPKSVLVERYFRERSAYDHGTIDGIQYWQHITKGYPAERDRSVLQTLAAMDVEIWSQRNEATVGWLPRLRRAGITLGLLSNMPESFADALEQRDRWLWSIDHRIYSGRAGLSKPDAAIYRLLIDQLNTGSRSIEPANVLFLDDLEANVEAARAVGLRAEVYNAFDGGLSTIAKRYDLPVPLEPQPTRERLEDTECAPHRRNQ